MRYSSFIQGLILSVLLSFIGSIHPLSGYADQIWNIPVSKFTEDIKKGDTQFLATMDPKLIDPEHVKNLGPGGGLYLSYVFEKLKRPEEAVLMLETEIANSKEEKGGKTDPDTRIFFREASYRLICIQGEKKSPEGLARAESLILPAAGDRRVSFLFADAYFKAGMYREALKHLDTSVSQRSGTLNPSEEVRAAFIRAASGARLDLSGWDRLYITLFTTAPSSGILVEAYEFLGKEKLSLSRFTADELDFMRARYDTYKQEYHKARIAFSRLIARRSPVVMSEEGLSDAGKAFAGSGEAKQGAVLLKELGNSLSTSILPDMQLKAAAAYRASGNLYRRLGQYTEARTVYGEALKRVKAEDKDRILWAMMACDLSLSPEALVKNLHQYAPMVNDPSFFSDILEELSTALVTKRSWSSFPLAFAEIKSWAADETVAAYAYITLRAMDEGYIKPGAPSARELLDAVLSRHAKSTSALYYLFLTSSRAGVDPIRFYAETETQKKSTAPQTETERLSRGFLSFGLIEEAFTAATARMEDLSQQAIREIAAGFIEAGGVYEALRFLNRATDREDFILTKSDLYLLFPDAYSAEIEEACKREGLDRHIFTGLVREESFFKADVVSRAGAVGLSQLMPSTAKDVATRMGMRHYDILDPKTNLSIGAYYLSHLLSRTGDIPQALFAYNGGLTRVRRWTASGKDLPGDLFVESIPIQETRQYLRKVLVSSVLYGHLYGEKKPEEVIRTFFPTFPRNN
ncbi:MAG TPA: transglycosylase SLT domain-containing protein [Spirochaetia bacterium]|nr:transglycosylase SLT domain-containing protein [Spirochaetia bacterium]